MTFLIADRQLVITLIPFFIAPFCLAALSVGSWWYFDWISGVGAILTAGETGADMACAKAAAL